MSEIVDQITFHDSGLNYDDDPRFFKKGDTDYRLNVIPSALGDTYVLTNMKGTTKKEHSFTHHADYNGATYTSLGGCYDIKRNAIYFFIYSDLTNHCILRYNIDDDDFDKIVWDNENIGLDTDYPINDAFMIGDWLYWNPRSSSPRSLNVEWAYYTYVATQVVETDPATSWSVGDYCGFRNKVYQALSAVDTGTIPIGGEEHYDFVTWTYGSLSAFYQSRAFFNTPLQPRERVSASFLDDTDVHYNEIWGKVFQFTYRYHIPELGISSAAPFSEVVADFEGEIFNGQYVGEATRNNRIRVRVPLYMVEDAWGGAEWLFSRVDVLFREAGDGRWRLMKSLDHDEVYSINQLTGGDEYFYVDFYNDGAYSFIDDALVEKPYNYLPVLADSQSALDGERCAYGGVTEGLNAIPIDASVSSTLLDIDRSINRREVIEVDSYAIDFDPSLTVYGSTGYNNPLYYGYESPTISTDGVSADDRIIAYVNEQRCRGVVTSVGTANAYADDIVNTINEYTSYGAERVDGPKVRVWSTDSTLDINVYVYSSLAPEDEVVKVPSFKAGDHHQFCLFYWDENGRRSNPIYNEDLRVYIPFLPEYYQQITAVSDQGGSPNEVRITCTAHGYSVGDIVEIVDTTNYDGQYTVSRVNDVNTFDVYSSYTDETFGDAAAVTSVISTNHSHAVSWSVSHQPPDYAVQWGLGYTGRQTIGSFTQVNVYSVAVGSSEYADYVGLNIKGLQELTDDNSGDLDIALPNSLLEPYEFQEGDRVRVITRKDASAAAYDELLLDNWTEYIRDYEVKAFDPSTDTIYIDVEGTNASWVADYNDNSVIIEIYRPRELTDTLVFYEIGQRYGVQVSDGSRYHLGAGQDQADYDGSTPATGQVVAGDVYLITRAFGVTPASFDDDEMVLVESTSWSDYYPSTMWGQGKAAFDSGIQQVKLNNVRYGNKLQPNAQISGVGVFDGLDYKTLSYNYGDITAIRQIGNVLKVVFENNIASVLVNKTQFYDADGQSQVVKSDQVLGSVNYSEEAWGSVNPESVLVVDRNLYFFDLRRKAYVRNAPNGSFPISEYKMKKYFRDKADALLSSGESNIEVYSAWDEEHGLLYVGFNDTEDKDNCEYVLFHEASNRWVTFASVDHATQYDLLAINDDTSLDTQPNFSLSSSFSSNEYVSIISVNNASLGGTSASYNDNVAFNPSSTITLQSGDSYSLSFQVTQSTSTGLGDILQLRIYGTGGIDNVVVDLDRDYVATAYTLSGTLSEQSTIYIEFALNGDTTISENAVIEITWSAAITSSRSLPFISTAPALLSISGEDVYIHNDNSTRCNLWGTQQEYQVRVYSNEAANIIKLFDSIGIHSNAAWDVEDIQIPISPNYSSGMQSRLKEGRFEKEEGVYRSDYLCNIKSSSGTANVVDLLNGDSLRGYYIYNDLVGDKTTEHTLFKVDILSTPSKY